MSTVDTLDAWKGLMKRVLEPPCDLLAAALQNWRRSCWWPQAWRHRLKIIFGEAGTTCRTWTQARQTKSRKAGLSAQWIAGYLSGSNVEADHPADVLVGTNFDGLMAWIDNYCRANPLDLVGTAALTLFDELKLQAQRR